MTAHILFRLIPAFALWQAAGSPLYACDGGATVYLNQTGFTHEVTAAVSGPCGDRLTLVDAAGTVKAEAMLGEAGYWAAARTSAGVATVEAPAGTYLLRVMDGDAIVEERRVQLMDDPFAQLHKAVIHGFYLNRSGVDLEEKYAGQYRRPAGHPDTRVSIHASAVGPMRKEGDTISAPRGWYDAGDYNKYVVNSGIATYTLMAAYERDPSLYQSERVAIPEAQNSTADLLDEVAWNLQWMLSMQDPADGGVYHKLTTLNFAPMVMPDEATEDRFVVQKSTAAALHLAAVAATAARVFAPFDDNYPGLADSSRKAAMAAWAWANRHPNILYQQPTDVHTGTYAVADEDLRDEFLWAATELFLITGDSTFLAIYKNNRQGGGVPSWASVESLALISLSRHTDRVPDDVMDQVRKDVLRVADMLVDASEESPFGVPAGANAGPKTPEKEGHSFVWGSNGHVANQGVMLMTAFDLTGDPMYHRVALDALDYLLGRNPLGISFVTGFGDRSPGTLHHRVSVADSVPGPLPGLLAGGPNQDRQDAEICGKEGKAYPSTAPALSYLDEVCSYASNETAINWNAPLVYLIGALRATR